MTSTNPTSLYTSATAPSTTSTHSLASTPPSSTYPSTSTPSQPPPPKPPSTTTFLFPRTHAFPPFFTLQPQSSTLHAQLQKWSSLILSYHAFHKTVKLSFSTALQSDLFWNKEINRRLDEKGVKEVLEFMRREGKVEAVNSRGGKDVGGDVWWVWWRSVEEWGGVIEGWVEETAQKNTVLTLYELTQSDATLGQDFHGIDPELLQKALSLLVKRGKAQIFGQEDQQGVKFF